MADIRANSPRARTLLIAGILAPIGYIANMLALPVAFGVDFIFGSIFTVFAVRILGLRWGIGVAVVASSYTFLLWNHPYAIIIFTAEAAWIGLALKRGRSNILLIDALFWLLLGMPLVILFYAGAMQMGMQHTIIIALKQSLNGIFNALVACMILLYTPVGRLSSDLGHLQQPFSTRIFHLIAASLMIPTLVLIQFESHFEVAATQERIARELKSEASETEEMLARWIESHVNAARVIASLGSRHPLLPSLRLQEDLRQIHTLSPDFHNVFLANAESKTIAFHPEVNERGESTIGINFADRAWFKQLNSTLQPTISDVFMGRGGVFAPIFSISVPVVKNGRLSHFGLGAINLDRMQELLKRSDERKDLYHTVVDRNSNVIISNVPGRTPLSSYKDKDSTHTLISSGVYLRVPGKQKFINKMTSWKNANYYTRIPIRGTSWTLLMEYPVAPIQAKLYRTTIWSLGIIAVLFALMISIASILSRRITRPLKVLSGITRDIPGQIDKNEPMYWPVSSILEIAELTDNFRQTAESIKNQIQYMQGSNLQLDKKVEERTHQLSSIMLELGIILENCPIGISKIIDRKQVLVNRKTVEMFQYSKDEMEFQTTRKLYPSDEAFEKFGNEAYPVLAQGLIYDTVRELIRKDGSHILVRYVGKAVDPSDMSKGVIWMLEDVTTLKEAEAKLEKAADEWRKTFDLMPDQVSIIAPDYSIVKTNKAFDKAAGKTREELVGMKCFCLVHGINNPIDGCPLSRTVKEKKECYEELYDPHLDKHLYITATPMFADDGTIEAVVHVIRDITERKRAEVMLFESQSLLNNIINGCPDAIYSKDIAGRYKLFNNAAARFVGKGADDVLGKDDYSLFPPEVAELTMKKDRETIEAGTLITFEETLTNSAGLQSSFLVTKGPLRDVTGEIYAIFGISRDVTKLKQAEIKLLESQQQLLLSQEIGKAGSWMYHLDTNRIWGSAEGFRIFGFQPVAGDFPIDDFEACIPERERVHQTLVNLISGKGAYDIEYDINPADGSPAKTVHSVARLEKDSDGNPLKVVGFVQDITERKQIDDALRRFAKEQSIILDNAGVGITFVQNRQFKWINATLSKIFGYRQEEIINSCTSLIYPTDEDYVQTGEEAYLELATGRTFTKELLLRRSDGSLFHAMYNGKAVDPANPAAGSIWIISDETDRYELQSKLIRAVEVAESANRAKSEFLANMSHEIRTPMNGLLGMTQLLEMSDMTEVQRDYLKVLKKSGNNLLTLINDILDLSKIEAGKLEIAQTEFSLHSCVNDIVTLQKTAAHDKGLVLEADISEEIPKILIGDQLRLKQIILNLLGNAVKFTSRGGITLSAQLIKQQDDTAIIEIAVSDSGVGISAEALEKIFRPFEQEDGTITRKYGGSGLGLSISRQLTELMGGRITVESMPSAGSCFKATIPLTVGHIDETAAIAPNTPMQTWHGAALRILLVEDDQINIMFGATLLRKLGHDVTVAENGEECLAALQQGRFDVVLMDIQMPVMNGEEAMLEIRRLEQETRNHQSVIALTAHSLRGEKERFMDEGFDGYVSKPLEIGELIDEMKRVMERQGEG